MKSLSCFVLAALACIGSAAGISPKFSADLDRAEAALAAGDAAQAEALAGLVRMPVIRCELPAGATWEQKEAARRGFAMWTGALDGAVEFQLAEPAQGDVRLVFSPQVWHAGQDVAGKAVWSRTAQKWAMGSWSSLLSATLHIRTEIQGRPRSVNEMAATVAHELGHLMGLADSDNMDHLMGPALEGQAASGPSPEEAEALKSLQARADELLFSARVHLGTFRTEG